MNSMTFAQLLDSPGVVEESVLRGRFGFMDTMVFTLTLFNLIIEDEIYYSEVNRNYEDNTVRRGIEADVRYRVAPFLYLWGTYTYTHARFEEQDTAVPLVPENMASAGLEWQVIDPLKLFLNGILVGERYDGNDIDNTTYTTLDPYFVCDTRATYQYGGFKFFAGINNHNHFQIWKSLLDFHNLWQIFYVRNDPLSLTIMEPIFYGIWSKEREELYGYGTQFINCHMRNQCFRTLR